ncbi:DNA-binding LacI/PurR family transcriptional regulator [Neobacillus niacini]|uniref:LacI family DNA-binding transcriptional regulator n=1 Tax=Neobacillus niacini TaxID=86668 RepID=UPI0028614BEF|nr:LacI family DNA-binding transcriptional regulator [Neobacillus niacini]MDR7079544.1 DNA-binding LacI/PurR family transcriptional regulator [Neobacillus niacini]
MKETHVTIKDIAKKAEVSVATVSYVINNTRYVSPEKIERVNQAIKDLNYVPNAVARGLRFRQSKIIGLTITDITNPFYPELAKACETEALINGYTLILINTNDDRERTAIATSYLREGRIDGLIITTALEHDRSIIEKMIEENYPIVLVHRTLDNIQVDTVLSDNAYGSSRATKHLIDLGHRRICFMGGVDGSTVGNERVMVFQQTMREHGLPVMEEWNLRGEVGYKKSYEDTKRLMNLSNDVRPTAIINISDIGALGVIDAALEMGMRIPEDLAVIGFDDVFITSTKMVGLTTVHIPSYELGRVGTKILIDRINKKELNHYQNVTLPVKLMVRGTCGYRNQKGNKM